MESKCAMGPSQLNNQEASTISSCVCLCVWSIGFGGASNNSPWRYTWMMRQSLRCTVLFRLDFFDDSFRSRALSMRWQGCIDISWCKNCLGRGEKISDFTELNSTKILTRFASPKLAWVWKFVRIHYKMLISCLNILGAYAQCVALHQVEWGGEESEAQWPAGCAQLQSGCHLCEECEPCCRVE